MKRLILISVISAFVYFMVSCYYDSEEALYPTLNTACDTANVTFSLTVAPMLSDNCYSCHSNANAPAKGNNVALENYADVAARNVTISQGMKHLGPTNPMPKNGGKVSDCAINQFDLWVKKGMLNN